MTHAVGAVGWDQIDGGWTIWCDCGFVTEPYPLMEHAGADFDDHLREAGVLQEE